MKILIAFSFLCLTTGTFGVAQNITWEKSLGGSGSDIVLTATATSDGGFLVGAYAESTDGHVTGNHGASDIWLTKSDAQRNVQWQKCYGGFGLEIVAGIVELPSGGYAVLGSTRSLNEGASSQVQGNHGVQDYLLVFIDDAGNFLRSYCYGGRKQEDARCIIQTSNGNLLLVGSTQSELLGSHGDWDGYAVCVSVADGSILWQRLLGGSLKDYLYSVVETPEGNFALTGASSSTNDDLQDANHQGDEDLWVAQIDANGNLLWSKKYGGSAIDGGRTISQMPTGDLVVAGVCDSQNGDVWNAHGQRDAWVVYLSEDGTMKWNLAIGGAINESGFSVLPLNDQEFLVGGETSSFNGDITNNHGGRDAFVFKLNAEGDIEHKLFLGGTKDDFTRSLIKLGDGKILVAATAASFDGDVSQNLGNNDAWLVILGEQFSASSEPFTPSAMWTIYPNPAAQTIHCSSTQSNLGFKASIYDVKGVELVASGLETGSVTLPVVQLAPGVYFVKFQTELGQVYVQSFVKE
ncbi:MAG: T9SS type A sorting domain-containing protein [Saprospiraceae bacterium]|nr:T9SS type A sorting domain-containing protein [Saprospiraceae bacterium]